MKDLDPMVFVSVLQEMLGLWFWVVAAIALIAIIGLIAVIAPAGLCGTRWHRRRVCRALHHAGGDAFDHGRYWRAD